MEIISTDHHPLFPHLPSVGLSAVPAVASLAAITTHQGGGEEEETREGGGAEGRALGGGRR